MSFWDDKLFQSFLGRFIDKRLVSLKHEAKDHVDRALDVIKVKPSTSGSLVGTDGNDVLWVPPASTNGSVLTSDTSQTGEVKWMPPVCGLAYYSSSGATVNTNTWLAITTLFNTIEYEKTLAGSSHYNTTTGRFTPPVNGVYRFMVKLAITAATSGETYGIGLFKNGVIFHNNHIDGVGNGYFYDARMWDVYLTTSDYVQAGWFQTTATNRTWSNGRRDCAMSWDLIHAF